MRCRFIGFNRPTYKPILPTPILSADGINFCLAATFVADSIESVIFDIRLSVCQLKHWDGCSGSALNLSCTRHARVYGTERVRRARVIIIIIIIAAAAKISIGARATPAPPPPSSVRTTTRYTHRCTAAAAGRRSGRGGGGVRAPRRAWPGRPYLIAVCDGGETWACPSIGRPGPNRHRPLVAGRFFVRRRHRRHRTRAPS